MDAPGAGAAAAATSVQVAVRVRQLTPQEEAEGARGVVLVQDECGRVEVGHCASAKAFTCVPRANAPLSPLSSSSSLFPRSLRT